MSEPPPEQMEESVEEEDEVEELMEFDVEELMLRTSLSLSPSILRAETTTSRPPLSEAPSVTISLPDINRESLTEETPEQRQRRRMRFLEMRREHYSQMLHHTEQCTMTDDDELQELASTSRREQHKNEHK